MHTERLALSINDAVAASGIGRTKIFEAIKEGRLTARKAGRRTIILHDDLARFLQALPTKGTA